MVDKPPLLWNDELEMGRMGNRALSSDNNERSYLPRGRTVTLPQTELDIAAFESQSIVKTDGEGKRQIEKFVEVTFTKLLQTFESVKGLGHCKGFISEEMSAQILEEQFHKVHDSRSLFWMQTFSFVVGVMSFGVAVTYTASQFEGVRSQSLVPALYYAVFVVLFVFASGVRTARHTVIAVDEVLVQLEDALHVNFDKVKSGRYYTLLPKEVKKKLEDCVANNDDNDGRGLVVTMLKLWKQKALNNDDKDVGGFYLRIIRSAHFLFLSMVVCIVLILALFPYSYQWWLRGKGKQHLVYTVKASAILRFVHVVVPMMLCITTQGLYFSDLVKIVIPFTLFTTTMLTIFYTEEFLEKGLADDYGCGDPFDCDTEFNSVECSYEDSYPVYLALWQNDFFAVAGVLFAVLALLNRRANEYDKRIVFVQNFLLQLRIDADADIFNHQKSAAETPFLKKNLKIEQILGWGHAWTVKSDRIKSNFDDDDLIGSGTFGKVYKGQYDVNSFKTPNIKPTMVALKCIREDIGDTCYDDVCREANAQYQIRHDNIVNFYGIHFPANTTPYRMHYVMELMVGSLEEAIHKPHCPHYEEWHKRTDCFYRAVLDIVNGMVALHNRALVHSDLKPANILISENFTMKICDFGLARTTNRTCLENNEGTPEYMAPEVFKYFGKDLEVYGNAADAYSFGIVLWEMCNQEKPYLGFEFGNVVRFRDEVTKGGRPDKWRSSSRHVDPIMSLQPPLLRFLENIIKRCWSSKPEHRPTFSFLKDEIKRNNPLLKDRNGPVL